jgi:hypothetical protein
MLLLLGFLPAEVPTTLWAGQARDPHRCGACGERTGDVEYELVFGERSVFFHFACYHVWDQERLKEITTGNYDKV